MKRLYLLLLLLSSLFLFVGVIFAPTITGDVIKARSTFKWILISNTGIVFLILIIEYLPNGLKRKYKIEINPEIKYTSNYTFGHFDRTQNTITLPYTDVLRKHFLDLYQMEKVVEELARDPKYKEKFLQQLEEEDKRLSDLTREMNVLYIAMGGLSKIEKYEKEPELLNLAKEIYSRLSRDDQYRKGCEERLAKYREEIEKLINKREMLKIASKTVSEEDFKRLHELQKMYKYLAEHAEIWNYESKWHEIGHAISSAYKIPPYLKRLKKSSYSSRLSEREHMRQVLDEGFAIGYGWLGLLRSTKEGKFSVDEVQEILKWSFRHYKLQEKGNIHREAIDMFFSDFDPTRPVDESIDYLERKLYHIFNKGVPLTTKLVARIRKLFG
ncbi:MAG: hypothetical protein QXU74_01455 [Candidatus Aenigmatarchaeota archaeon]